MTATAGLFLIGMSVHGTARLVVGIIMILIGIINYASDNR